MPTNAGLSGVCLRSGSVPEAGALKVAGGRLVDARRAARGENRAVVVRVRPASHEDVALTLRTRAEGAAAVAWPRASALFGWSCFVESFRGEYRSPTVREFKQRWDPSAGMNVAPAVAGRSSRGAAAGPRPRRPPTWDE